MTTISAWVLGVLVVSASLGADAIAADCTLPGLDKDVQLQSDCTYHGAARITRPVHLDCNGATLEGDGVRATGILIDSEGGNLRGVEIRNCVVKGFTKLGIGIGWSVPDGKKRTLAGGDDPTLYLSRTPSNTVISGVTVEDIGGVGIYVDDHVTGTLIERSTVQRVKGAGVYLEHDSGGTRIRNSKIVQSGWDGERPMQPGIAVDSSSDNRIEGSTVSGNGLGGIFLYRNCQERGLTDPESVPRMHGANHNLIQGNRIDGRTGIWVGSRMSRNLRSMACGRQPYYKTGDMDIVLDEATENRIVNNTIGAGQWGMIVEDNGTSIEGNTFIGPYAGGSLLIGTKYRATVMNEPVKGTALMGNRIPPGQDPKWLYGSKP